MKHNFLLHNDNKPLIDKLSDERAGKLLKAFFEYSATGQVCEMDEITDLVFTAFKSQFDRDKEKYAMRCEQNSENGKSGGRQKKQTDSNESEKSQSDSENATASERKQTQANANEKKRTQTKKADSDSDSDSDIPPISPTGDGACECDNEVETTLTDFSEKLTETVNDWFGYKAEKRQPYKPTGRAKLLSQITSNIKTYGEEKVIDVINRSMSSNYQGILWTELERASNVKVMHGDLRKISKSGFEL